MKIIFLCLFLFSLPSHSVILIPGKIEEPKRAAHIFAEKFIAKKAAVAKFKSVLLDKITTKTAAEPISTPPLALLPDDQIRPGGSVSLDQPIKMINAIGEIKQYPEIR